MKKYHELIVCIIDDSPHLLTTLDKALRDLGVVEVVRFTSGEDAYEAIKETILDGEPLDLIICDQHMGKMSGIDLLREIRTFTSKEDLPFILLTSDSSRKNIIQLSKNGGNDFIVKPLEESVLNKKIVSVFNEIERA